MLGVVIDLVIIIAMQAMLEGGADEWRDLIWPVLGITLGNLAIAWGLVGMIGLFVLIPMAILTAAILILICNMQPKNALITTVVLIGVKFGIALAMNG